MHADDQHLLVIGTVEDADPSAFRQVAGRSPEKIVLQFGGAGMLEAEYLAALRWTHREAVAARSVAKTCSLKSSRYCFFDQYTDRRSSAIF
jgi:hypothetical protein